jgi:proline iminopeptidase
MKRDLLVGVVILSATFPAVAHASSPPTKPLAAVEGTFPGADGVRLFYRKVGSGKDVAVYLHGGPGLAMEDGGYDLEPLAQGRTLILYDQRGCGRSELVSDPKKLTVEDNVRDLEALRQHFKLERMALIGLSWGSGLAVRYAAEHPDRVSRLLLVSPMPVARTPFRDERIANTQGKMDKESLARLQELNPLLAKASDADMAKLCREWLTLAFKPYFYDAKAAERRKHDECTVPPASLRNLRVVSSATFASLGDWDFRPLLAKLKMPALVVEGEKTQVPLDSTRLWASTMPNARLLLIPEAGHMHFVERPEAFFPAAEQFLRGGWPAQGQKGQQGQQGRQ